MKQQPSKTERLELKPGSKIAVVGGGPAGSFFALHLLRRAAKAGISLEVTIFERHRSSLAGMALSSADRWKGCNYCAGGLSPKLNDVLNFLGLQPSPAVIQGKIKTVTIQGFWKNIEIEVPRDREMLAVYRGSRPDKRFVINHSFDCFLLDQALKAGAGLISAEVQDLQRNSAGRPVVLYSTGGMETRFEADLLVCATGVNENLSANHDRNRLSAALQRLLPDFVPPKLRQTLIFELEARPSVPEALMSAVYFVEYGSRKLPLEMCSVVPKRNFVTVTLVGRSVDKAETKADTQRIVKDFLELPHIRKLVSPGVFFNPVCACRPRMVLGSARKPYGERVAAVGDLVTSRLYKDGILSACQTADALAETVLSRGIDATSLGEGYEPVLRHFRSNNRVAALVFLIHRIFFSSSVLSRILYQAVIAERKTTPSAKRNLEKILWRIASGDDEYKDIFASLMRPRTVWSILTGGVLLTLRNYLTELWFGLDWKGFGRFTTGVAIERLQDKRNEFSKLIADASVSLPGNLEFERMYTIKIAATRERILAELGRFGETDRGYLRPRWLRVQRIAGEPNTPGCVIQYEVVHKALSFSLVLEQIVDGHLAIYRVQNGFARSGILIFEIEKISSELSALSIYVAFNFARGLSWTTQPFWWAFRLLFPAFVHDVLWNHSLCQFKDIVETEDSRRFPRSGEFTFGKCVDPLAEESRLCPEC